MHDPSSPLGIDTRRMMAAIERSLFDAPTPVEVARFVLGRKLGSGAMGAVYAAYDPELDREVAVKIVRHGLADEEYGRRLIREAEAMATLSHPNVLTVYAAGLVDGQPYIATELVDGGTLGEWQKQPRTTAEILAMYLAAAEGLAAAHEAGLVHRDFKPANVLVGRDGRPRVADFGLVRVGAPRSAEPPAPRSVRSLVATMTTTGTIVGTPAYMAPEQHDGESATPRSDQFSFCVSLFEALHGERPFAGRTAGELAQAMRSGTASAGSSRMVPRHVHRALMRGLSLAPSARHPSMHALAAQLRRSVTYPWRLAALGVIALALGGAWVAARDTVRECDPDPRIDAVWTDARREQLDDEPAREIAEYLAGWRETYLRACGELADAPELDAVMRCLDGRLEHVDAALELLATPAPAQRVEPRRIFDPVDECRSGERPSQEDAATRAELVRARTIYQLGRFAEAIALAQELRRKLQASGDDRLLAEASLLLGLAFERAGEVARADLVLAETFTLAKAVGDDDVAMSAATRLAFSLAENEADVAGAEQWLQHASTLSVEDPELLFALRNSRATVARARGDLAEARALFEENLRLYEGIFGTDTKRLGTLHSNIAMTCAELDDVAKGVEHAERAVEIHAQNLDPNHPEVAIALVNLAVAQDKAERHADAEASLLRALAIRRAAFGEQHPKVATVLSHLANNAQQQGQHDRAVEYGREALAMSEATFGPVHLETADATADLADIYRRQGRAQEARPLFERALVIEIEVLGPEHRRCGMTLDSLARVLLDLGEPRLAMERERQAQAIMIAHSGPLSRDAALTHTMMARIHHALGELELAFAERTAAAEAYEALHDLPGMAGQLNYRGDLLRELGRPAEALEAHRRAAELHTQAFSATHSYVGYTLHRIGLALEQMDRLDEAAIELERAMAIRERDDGRVAPDDLRETRAALARVELARGRTRG